MERGRFRNGGPEGFMLTQDDDPMKRMTIATMAGKAFLRDAAEITPETDYSIDKTIQQIIKPDED
jgi:hypothetical protein